MRVLDFTMVALLLLCTILVTYYIYNDHRGVASCDMKFPEQEVRGINGVWYYDNDQEYVCVMIDGKTDVTIKNNIQHEYCHSLVVNDYDHFCNKEVERFARGVNND